MSALRHRARSAAALPAVILALLAACAGLAGCGTARGHAQTIARTTRSQATAPGGTSTATTPADSLPGYRKPTVLVGDMNTPEQFVLGELYAYALRAQGYRVTVTRNIGIASVAQQALRQGSLDLYPDYLDQFDSSLAGVEHPIGSLSDALRVARAYAATHGIALLSPTPFSDVAALAVTSLFARENHIRTLPQLARGAALVIGAPPEFADASTGLPALEHAYGIQPAIVEPIAIGAQYAALTSNQIQAAYVQSTDPQLDGFGFRQLTDPDHATGIGNVVPVTTPKVIAAEGPAFAEAIDRVDALLTLSAMRGLNAEVQLDHADPTVVAEELLQANGLAPAPSAPGSP